MEIINGLTLDQLCEAREEKSALTQIKVRNNTAESRSTAPFPATRCNEDRTVRRTSQGGSAGDGLGRKVLVLVWHWASVCVWAGRCCTSAGCCAQHSCCLRQATLQC